jgi:hypothetical protein
MSKIPPLHPTVRACLLDCSTARWAEQVPAYIARLRDGRYASNTVARCLGASAPWRTSRIGWHCAGVCVRRIHLPQRCRAV